MLRARWIGPLPPATVRQALSEAGLRTASRGADIDLVWSVHQGPVPRPAVARFVWLCREPLTEAAVREAALAGAYDSASITELGWAARVAARAAEFGQEEDPVPEVADFVAVSEASRALLKQLWRAARTSMPVLLTGETGTGKDLGARLIHSWSSRRRSRFVPINCAAIPKDLIESELFGYARGAFSGAVRDYDGQLAVAAGGTVFLDEIDDTPPTLQVKLLRVVEDRVVSRLGENVWRTVDFRIIAATNRNLIELIGHGSFGADLYERLAIVQISIPPLRERLADLAALVSHLVARFYADDAAARDKPVVVAVCPRVIEVLAAYPWPGNVRELRNAVYQSLVQKRAGTELLVSDLPRRILERGAAHRAAERTLFDPMELERRLAGGQLSLRTEVARLERAALLAALERTRWNASQAARLLGEVGRGASADPGGTVRAMMRRLGLSRGGPTGGPPGRVA